LDRTNLFIQTAFVGDLLLSIPVLKRMRALDPSARLILLCRHGLGQFMLDAGIVDEVQEVRKKPSGNWGEVKRNLNKIKFNLIVCPHESFRTAMFVFGLNGNEKIGYWHLWNFFAFSKRCPRPMGLPESLRQLSLISELDKDVNEELRKIQKISNWQGESKGVSSLCFPVPGEKLPKISNMLLEDLDQQGPNYGLIHKKVERLWLNVMKTGLGIVFMAPGSEWATKRWRQSGYSELGKKLQSKGYQICLVGVAAEEKICTEISSLIPHSINFCGKTSLSELFKLFTKGKLLISNDSGAMHMAAVAGLPVVGIFGPTTLELGYRPWQEPSRVAEIKLECRPCGKHGAQICPLGTHACMQELSTDSVYKEVETVLLGDFK